MKSSDCVSHSPVKLFWFFRPRGPLSWLDPGAFGTLGVGGGFALGAKLCRSDSDVWIIYGDGSLGYSVAEIDTFTRHKVSLSLQVKLILLNFLLGSRWEDSLISTIFCAGVAWPCGLLASATWIVFLWPLRAADTTLPYWANHYN